MDSFVFVSANAYLSSRNTDSWHSNQFKPGYVPILRSDLLRFRDTLDKVLSEVRKDKTSALYQNTEVDKESARETDSDAVAVTHTTTEGRHQDLKQFLPISLDQQLHTISIKGFQGKYSIAQLELFLAKLDKITAQRLRLDGEDVISCWSLVTGLDTHNLFIRCREITKYPQAIAYWRSLIHLWNKLDTDAKMELHCDQNTSRFIEDSSQQIDPQDESLLAQDESLLTQDIDTLRQYLHELRSHDLGQAVEASASTDYKVDVSTLSDLPGSSLDQLCQDIIKFRTRVLTIEKEKRAKEDYEEGKRRRQQLMKVFEQIKKSQGDEKTNGAADNDDENEDDDDDDEDDGEDDRALEQERVERENSDADARFRALLEKLNTQIEPHMRSLEHQVSRMKDYDNTLLKERPLYLKELLHLAHDPYYDHRRSFKEDEQRRDDEDRKLAPVPTLETHPSDSQELPPAQVQEEPKFKLEIRNPAKSDSKLQPDILPYSDKEVESLVAKLRDSRVVHDVVKEYLGDDEEDLVEYIFDHIIEHKSKHALLEELKETFDEDSVAIANRVWNSL